MKASAMVVKALGDSAWLVEWKEPQPGVVSRAVRGLNEDRMEGVLDVVSSFSSLAVYYDPFSVDGLEVRGWLTKVLSEMPSDGVVPEGNEFRIPVKYGGEEGPDLEPLAQRLGMSGEELVALHSGAVHTVAAVGFLPGFPYLAGLPDRLNVPRLATPRSVVAAGSVAIASGKTGIYPVDSPGGWHVLGRAAECWFDPLANPPSMLRAGDRVKFEVVQKLEPRQSKGPSAWPKEGRIEVLRAGGMTTVQDLGRPGFGSSGVSPGGAADRQALKVANRLVGNSDGAAALEICLSGPKLGFTADAWVALVGADAPGWRGGRRARVKAGEILDIGILGNSSRAVLAISGGLKVPQILGSSATAVRAGFGGRCLSEGDWLDFHQTDVSLKCGDFFAAVARPSPKSLELRFLPGVQATWFSKEAAERLRGQIYHLTEKSDRMGSRLSGPALRLEKPREMMSQPVCEGSIQVPPDGQPIVLMAERQTIGGYPQIGHVISADMPKLARALPGTRLRFREVTWDEARQAMWLNEQDLDVLRIGLELL